MSLETLILITAARIRGVKIVLEFGTGLGYNAMHLAKNLDDYVITVDKDRKPRVFDGFGYRIHSVKADIFNLTPFDLAFFPAVDMVFCDVNYTLETTTRATELAFLCNPKVIAWHDYGHPDHPHVKTLLDDLSETKELVHIEDSWTVLWFKEGLEL
jgi:hypothetical protein